MYQKDNRSLGKCTYCDSHRYIEEQEVDRLIAMKGALSEQDTATFSPQQTVAIASITAGLGELLVDDKFIQDINKYKQQFDDPANDGEFVEDIFSSGDAYRGFRNRGIIQPNDICVIMLSDGFVNKKSSKKKSALYRCIVMNLLPDKKRYQNRFMLPLVLIGGPNKTKDLMSFFTPILKEFHHLAEHGLRVKKNNELVYLGKVQLLGYTGDVPGIKATKVWVPHVPR